MEGNDEASSETTASLFPAFSHSKSPQFLPSEPSRSNKATISGAVQWLQNPSFTTDLSVIAEAVSMYDLPSDALVNEEEKSDDSNSNHQQTQYEMVASSDSDKNVSSGGGRKKRKRMKGKRKGESDNVHSSYYYANSLSSSSRKPGVQKWASTSTPASGDKEYYFDSVGDRDNLAFGSIYRMDVAHYKHYNSKEAFTHSNFRRNRRVGGLDRDNDIDSLDSNLRSGGRYWSTKYSAVERHKNLKRSHIHVLSKPVRSSLADFVPLIDKASDGTILSSVTVTEESWEDEVLRRAKDFNMMTRDHPRDESIWLAFAKFQDKVASMQPHKGARLQILEKKISILEKATEINPDSEDLLLSLLNAYQTRDSSDVLMKRWMKILISNSGSYKLWMEFFRTVQGEFSTFKVSEMRKIFANAIKSLSGACIKLHRQVHQPGNSTPSDPAVVQMELGLVDVFIGLCRFEWQAGYQELTTALFQAEIEYGLFCPCLLLSEQSKHRLFEHFWRSDGGRIGEEGAVGWSTWLEKEEEQRQRLINEEASKTVEEGGWTGWFDPLSGAEEMGEIPASTTENDVVVGEFDDESEQKDDIESLLKSLGIDATAEADIKIQDTRTWTKWSKTELSKDFDQWMPLRSQSDQISRGGGSADAENDEQLFGTIVYEDVSDYLFSLYSEEAKMSLVLQFIDFYGGISSWTCTNSTSWVEKMFSLESLPCLLMKNLKELHNVLMKKDDGMSISLDLLVNHSDEKDTRINKTKFLRNATLLCLKAFPQNYILQEAALVAEELSNTNANSNSNSVTPCRTLAKNLLKNNRQDVLLCGVYAKREAFFGNIDHSRKVFDMALSSIEGLSEDARPNASLLYFWYAETEVSSNNSDSLSRAMHVLSILGSGTRYIPFKGQPSAMLQLRARQGFRDKISVLSATWGHGLVEDHSVALICSAALFEELTFGWSSALEILEHSFTMVLPERRRQSRQLESLLNYYVRMLHRHHAEIKFSKIWDAIWKGLQIYPFNSDLHSSLVEITHLHTSSNKLRWAFDDLSHKRNTAVVTWLYALSFELSTGGSKYRVRGLFERALENEKLLNSVILWRCYIEYERIVACNFNAAKRVFFRAIHACPWSKRLWLDGFLNLGCILTVRELSDLQEVMRDKELNLRTDIYEILLEDDIDV